MSGGGLSRTLERTESVLLGLPTVEGALARRDAGCVAPEDRGRFRERVAVLVAAQSHDGSWHGSLRETGLALLELADLAVVLGEDVPGARPGAVPPNPEPRADIAVPGADGGHALPAETVPAALSWLRTLRGGIGRFGGGCDPQWHRNGLCEHTLKGFHAPAPLADGPRDADLLVIDSARATEAALCWGERGPAERHLESLCRVVSGWAWPAGEPVLKASSAVAALGALLRGPVTPEYVRAIAEGIACLLRTQRADGTWHGVPLFDALELLLSGVARGYHVPEVDAALARSAQLLVLTQKGDGTWGAKAGARQPLTAWRVLRHVVGLTAGAQPAPA